MKRYKHSLSNYKLATMDMGKLVPVQLQEVLPGDSFRMATSALVRMSPMLAPIMHPITVRLHHWFVPSRLLWDQWEKFITEGVDENGDQLDLPTIPGAGSYDNKELHDYFGLPLTDNGDASPVNALPFRAYNLIWNEFYRDQDLQNERDLNDTTLASVSWRKDYFTASRPFPQKGPDIVLPIGTTAPITGTIDVLGNGVPRFDRNANTASFDAEGDLSDDQGKASWVDPSLSTDHSLVADLSQATGVTATEFREFFALQRYAEARARYGSRYTEYLRYLGVTPSDARLQRPEYLGGGKSPLQISEVLQTAYDTDSPVGSLRGHGITAIKTRGVRRFFEEHGYVITLMSVIPKSVYQDGTHRLWLRQSHKDFFQKELQNIGQQRILQAEIYDKESAIREQTFGYTDRYSEYCSTPSTVSGEFRDKLDFWHLARKFNQSPNLNEQFITCNPSKRVFASQTDHSLWCMINNQVVAKRMVKHTSVGKLV